jgi:hypothetical protein
MVNGVKVESMPESFRLVTKGTTFDCGALTPLRHLPGVDKIQVLQRATRERPGAELACGY